ncbi:MAG TPA: glutamine synthetase family protein [Chloroflexota bacterium]|nr:glutamine synthetase family protein [Chloroflexota bacterium]
MPSLLDTLVADNVAQLWVVYHDYSGLSHAKTVPPERFPDALRGGIGFAKANMDFNILDHQVPRPVFLAETGDFFAVPDPDTYAPLPYHPGTARVYSFLCLRDGTRWDGCPRTALAQVVERYRDVGLAVRAAFEPECYLFRSDGGRYVPADQSRMFTVDGLEQHAALLEHLMQVLRAMGLTVEQIGAEYGPGQYEINVRHAEPLRAADDLLTLKDALRALASQRGLLASFMPKPYADLPGCGLHVHLGLSDAGGRNALEGTDRGAAGLSALGRSFVGGLLAHAPALCGIGSPTVNSYKRLLPGSWSPAHVCYGAGNRAALVRIPDAGTRHVEFRAGDNTSNPYLFLAALLAAGLDGIQRGIDPGPAVTDDVGHLSEAEAAERRLALLPRSAGEALDALEVDELIMAALGPVIGPAFLRVKRSEAEAYAVEVGEWERRAYLETV